MAQRIIFSGFTDIFYSKFLRFKVNSITANITLEDQLTNFMEQFQTHLLEQPFLFDRSVEEIIWWNLDTKEKAVMAPVEFEIETELDENIEVGLALAELY